MKASVTAFLRIGTGEFWYIGQASNYAGFVETNGRGILHLRGFTWLTGNIDFPVLRQKLLSDSESLSAKGIPFDIRDHLWYLLRVERKVTCDT
jgi:hypothetical protein